MLINKRIYHLPLFYTHIYLTYSLLLLTSIHLQYSYENPTTNHTHSPPHPPPFSPSHSQHTPPSYHIRNGRLKYKLNSQYHTHLLLLNKANASIPSNNSYAPAPCGRRDTDGKYWCLPDFYFIGVSKAGTSSMEAHLRAHHMIVNIAGHIEGHFLDNHMERNMQTMQIGFHSLNNRPIVMEYTPNYISEDFVPEIITSLYDENVEILSKLKFLVALREPYARMVSSWEFKSHSHDNLHDFSTSIKVGRRDGDCISRCYEKHNKKNEDEIESFRGCSIYNCTADVGIMKSHVVKSMYFYQILVWFRYFHPSQFYIYTLEEFATQPLQVYRRILQFLDLPLLHPNQTHPHSNHSSAASKGFRSEDEVLAQLKIRVNENKAGKELIQQTKNITLENQLREYLAPHTKRLDDLLMKYYHKKTGYLKE